MTDPDELGRTVIAIADILDARMAPDERESLCQFENTSMRYRAHAPLFKPARVDR